MSNHNSQAKVQITNNFDGAMDITIHHVYSTSLDEKHTWKNVLSGSTTDSAYRITYNTGLAHWGKSTWQCTVVVHDGKDKGEWIGNSVKCSPSSDDDGKTLTFSVDSYGLRIALTSKSDTANWGTRP